MKVYVVRDPTFGSFLYHFYHPRWDGTSWVPKGDEYEVEANNEADGWLQDTFGLDFGDSPHALVVLKVTKHEHPGAVPCLLGYWSDNVEIPMCGTMTTHFDAWGGRTYHVSIEGVYEPAS